MSTLNITIDHVDEAQREMLEAALEDFQTQTVPSTDYENGGAQAMTLAKLHTHLKDLFGFENTPVEMILGLTYSYVDAGDLFKVTIEGYLPYASEPMEVRDVISDVWAECEAVLAESGDLSMLGHDLNEVMYSNIDFDDAGIVYVNTTDTFRCSHVYILDGVYQYNHNNK